MAQDSSLRNNMAVTVDIVILTVAENRLKTLLIKRANTPYQGVYALPGGFMIPGQSPEEAAKNILKVKAGVKADYLEQLYTFDRSGRDPRGQVISITYFALLPAEDLVNLDGDKTQEPQLFDTHYLPDVAFDHDEIIKYAIKRLRAKLSYTNVVYSLLPDQFTLTQLQNTYEIILGEQLDKRNFRKKILSLDLISPTNDKLEGGRHRPAQLYRFNSTQLVELDQAF